MHSREDAVSMDSQAWQLDLCAFPEFALHERQSTPALSGDDVVTVLPSILTQDASPRGLLPCAIYALSRSESAASSPHSSANQRNVEL